MVKKYLIIIVFCVLQLAGFSQAISLDSLLTPNELNWLHQNKDKIRYAPNPSWPPGDFIENGTHKGIVADYIKIFEEKLGITFQQVYFDNWTSIINGLQKKEVDFVGCIHKTTEREQYLLFTDPYLTIPLVIIIKSNISHEFTEADIGRMKLACVTDYASIDYLKKTFQGVEIIDCADDLSALIKTSFGEADGAVVDLMTATYL